MSDPVVQRIVEKLYATEPDPGPRTVTVVPVDGLGIDDVSTWYEVQDSAGGLRRPATRDRKAAEDYADGWNAAVTALWRNET